MTVRLSQQVPTEVGSLHVEESGDPAAPAVLLWPSLYCTGAVWEDQVAALEDAYRVVVLDPPGHGLSSLPPRRFSLAATASATLAVLDALGIDRVAVVGGAWGGMVGIQLAASAPGRVRALVLVNSPLDQWHGRRRLEIATLAVLIRLGGPAVVAPLLRTTMLAAQLREQEPARVRRFVEPLRHLDRRGLGRSARSAMLRRPSLLPLLPALDVPVLVIAGAEDRLWPPDRARAEAAGIRGARLEVVAGSAHLSAFEAPDAVNPLLLAFLAAHEE